MDLLGGSSTSSGGNAASSSGGSSRASSHSPSSTFAALPPTPPNPFNIPDVSMGSASNSYFNFLDDDFANSKVIDPLAPPPTMASTLDFLGQFAGGEANASLIHSSPDSGFGGGGSSESSASPVGIDPSLVGTPAGSKAMSDFDEEEEHEEEESHRESQQVSPVSAFSPSTTSESAADAIITPVKVGGKGKSARKGTVQSGGVVKKTGGASTSGKDSNKKENQSSYMTTTSVEPDDWRPTPEEYKKMSSKEKRQLRNKISARNFRVRRKEYISTLEGDIAERDRLIDHIRTELMGTKSENIALRQEIAGLKKALLEGRGNIDTPILPPPAPLPAVSAAELLASTSSSPASPQKTPKSPLLTPNTQKDLPTSPRLGARSFWGGAAGGLGSFGGITPVHTTFIPEWSSVLSGKPLASNAERRPSMLQENINPMLNTSLPSTMAGFNMGQEKKTPQPTQQQQQQGEKIPAPWNNNFDMFADRNVFTLKSMEDFRMQLWTRMGQQQAQLRSLQKDASSHNSNTQTQQPTGLAGNLRPHYFATKTSPALAALLSGKTNTLASSSSASSSYPTPPPSPPMRTVSPSTTASSRQAPTAEQQQAMLAAVASQTLVKKLGSAFWDAFSGSSSSSAHTQKGWDADKVRKVLEGKAVVKVVDVEPTPAPSVPVAPAAQPLRSSSAGTGVGAQENKECLSGLSKNKKECLNGLPKLLENLRL
ncbi:hypothetical protein K474DRAFT_1668174 [Panus rudis PR-1116 ss-1]|nr:hypothetical protein K474DRAFT_1668174 [Panus rudis PR-1116 ss-1]